MNQFEVDPQVLVILHKFTELYVACEKKDVIL